MAQSVKLLLEQEVLYRWGEASYRMSARACMRQILPQVSSHMWYEIWDRVREPVTRQVGSPVKEQVLSQVDDQLGTFEPLHRW